jgi:hypothetical protein
VGSAYVRTRVIARVDARLRDRRWIPGRDGCGRRGVCPATSHVGGSSPWLLSCSPSHRLDGTGHRRCAHPCRRSLGLREAEFRAGAPHPIPRCSHRRQAQITRHQSFPSDPLGRSKRSRSSLFALGSDAGQGWPERNAATVRMVSGHGAPSRALWPRMHPRYRYDRVRPRLHRALWGCWVVTRI